MDLQFLRGDPQAPKGHAIFVARSRSDSQIMFSTYCLVPPIPLSLTKYLPSFLAAQLPQEELRGGANMNVMPIPPMLEEGSNLAHLQTLAEYRDDDLCDLGAIDTRDEAIRMQLVVEACQEYGQLYFNYSLSFEEHEAESFSAQASPLDELDAEELLLQTMTDRERLTELGKLIGMARYALEGRDQHLLQETKQRMQRIAAHLPEKYRGSEITNAAIDSSDRGARLAQLYLERGFKLLDEEYADIPRIERAIRELQDS